MYSQNSKYEINIQTIKLFARDVLSEEIEAHRVCDVIYAAESVKLIIETIRIRKTTETIILPYPNARRKRGRYIIQGRQMVLSVSRH